MGARDDWDSDDEDAGDVETNVLLGVPDGTITSTADLVDPAVSRIGGSPVRLSTLFVARRYILTDSTTTGFPTIDNWPFPRYFRMQDMPYRYGSACPNLVSF